MREGRERFISILGIVSSEHRDLVLNSSMANKAVFQHPQSIRVISPNYSI